VTRREMRVKGDLTKREKSEKGVKRERREIG